MQAHKKLRYFLHVPLEGPDEALRFELKAEAAEAKMSMRDYVIQLLHARKRPKK